MHEVLNQITITGPVTVNHFEICLAKSRMEFPLGARGTAKLVLEHNCVIFCPILTLRKLCSRDITIVNEKQCGSVSTVLPSFFLTNCYLQVSLYTNFIQVLV